MKRCPPYLPILVLALLLAGCRPAAPEPTPTPTPSPADYLNMAADAMAAVQTVQFGLTREGAPIVLDPALGLEFVSAAGEYEAPDRVHASVNAGLGGNVLTVEMLWLPEGNYVSNPLTGAYAPQATEMPMDPVAMFVPETGLSQVLSEGLRNPALVGTESVEGIETRHLTATADAAVLAPLTLAELSGTLDLDLWLNVETARVVRVQITEESGDQSVIDFFGYDEPVSIPSPGGQ